MPESLDTYVLKNGDARKATDLHLKAVGRGETIQVEGINGAGPKAPTTRWGISNNGGDEVTVDGLGVDPTTGTVELRISSPAKKMPEIEAHLTYEGAAGNTQRLVARKVVNSSNGSHEAWVPPTPDHAPAEH
jgi:hypothetical protein